MKVRMKLFVISIVLLTLATVCQSASKYQVGTITPVKDHQSAKRASDVASYDVTLKVGNTLYVVLYTPPLGMNTVKYAAGRELLVLVGKTTITYNDILGQSLAVPILSQLRLKRQVGVGWLGSTQSRTLHFGSGITLTSLAKCQESVMRFVAS